jgi:hypothetical protein
MYSIFFYVLILLLLFVAKPPIVFDKDGYFKDFGIGGTNNTLFSFGVFTVALAVLSFYIFAIIDVFMKK